MKEFPLVTDDELLLLYLVCTLLQLYLLTGARFERASEKMVGTVHAPIRVATMNVPPRK